MRGWLEPCGQPEMNVLIEKAGGCAGSSVSAKYARPSSLCRPPQASRALRRGPPPEDFA
ncbi:hypothetical protein ACIHJG_39485 [Streptomyces sp. NPDC052415]|uniref:hypothetical protein n=1 Tax=Streptomyces sp. NPDC052415 TaxID=3365690 RepID=UPI0037CFFFA9